MGRPQYEVADVFRLSGAAYCTKHKLSKAQHKAMRAIEQCRTAALGGHIDACDECGHVRNRQAFSQLLKRLMAEDWVVYAKPPFAGPEQLLKYLGRYTHRVAMGNHRIVSMDKDMVCFRWRDYADGNKQKVMCLSHEEFIRRFLQHCLPARFCKIRYSSPAEASAKAGRHPVQPAAKAGFGPLPASFRGKPAAAPSGSFLAGALPAGNRH